MNHQKALVAFLVDAQDVDRFSLQAALVGNAVQPAILKNCAFRYLAGSCTVARA